MDNSDLTPAMQEMLAEMAGIRAEINSLKERAQALPPVSPPTAPTSTRRKTLKRLGLALLGGAAAATVVGGIPAQAKVIANPALGSSSKAGAIVVPLGTPVPTGYAPSGKYYGLIASASTTALNLSNLPYYNTGIYGSGTDTGVMGSGGSFGVYANSTDTGVYGGGYYGVYGDGTDTGIIGTGPTGVWGYGGSYGVYGSGSTYGVYGTGTSYGVYGTGTTYGVYGTGSNYAGYFQGKVTVTGALTKPSGSFKIDHPLDPANKYLYHSFVESPDMLNIYNGIATLDEQGQATVEMPDWFEALNFDFRYQLTCLGEFAPVYVAEKLANRKFKIAGGKPGQEVSWQVTGIRQDEWAKAHRIPVEEDKTGDEKGKYLHPELFGQPEEMAVGPRPLAPKKR